MAVRKIIKIDENKCNGCGLCIPNCAEGAIQIVGGKAQLVADKYCDGLGACLGHCPEDALILIEREADDFDEAAVEELLAKQKAEAAKAHPVRPVQVFGHGHGHVHGGGCPGSKALNLKREETPTGKGTTVSTEDVELRIKPQLQQWPIQLMLVPVDAPYFKNADLLITADCVAVAYPNYQLDLLKNKKVAMACPKLDNGEYYVEKLTEMIRKNDFNSVTVAVMEVPCCAGLVRIVETAVSRSGKPVKLEKVTIGVHGEKK